MQKKMFETLKDKKISIPSVKFKAELVKFKTCVHFRKFRPRGFWRQPPFPLELRNVLNLDFIGQVHSIKKGVVYIGRNNLKLFREVMR